MSDGYRRFVSSLKEEVTAQIDKRPPRMDILAEVTDRTTRPGRRWVWVAAAVLVVAMGGASFPIISSVQTRRLINAANRSFLDQLFDRSLFESSGFTELKSSDWFDAVQISKSLEI